MVFRVNKIRLFPVHRYKLKGFSKLKIKIDATPTPGVLKLTDNPEDFYNTFKMLLHVCQFIYTIVLPLDHSVCVCRL
jgi:hypothetical protein